MRVKEKKSVYILYIKGKITWVTSLILSHCSMSDKRHVSQVLPEMLLLILVDSRRDMPLAIYHASDASPLYELLECANGL